jgi:hypothetical protein
VKEYDKLFVAGASEQIDERRSNTLCKRAERDVEWAKIAMSAASEAHPLREEKTEDLRIEMEHSKPPLKQLKQEIFDALNMARTNPLKMAEEVFKLMLCINSAGTLVLDYGSVQMEEGRHAYEDTCHFLSHDPKPLKALKISSGLNKALKKHARKDFQSGYKSMGPEVLTDRGVLIGDYAEAIEFGPWKTGLEFVIAFLVEDGSREQRKNRTFLFDSKLSVCGLGIVPNFNFGESKGNAVIFTFAEDFVEAVEEEESPEPGADQSLETTSHPEKGESTPEKRQLKRRTSSAALELERAYEEKIDQGKKNFANVLCSISASLIVAAMAVDMTAGIGFQEIHMGINLYMLLLVWADTLPQENPVQTKIMTALLILSSWLYFLGRVSTEREFIISLWAKNFAFYPVLFLATWYVLKEMASIIKADREIQVENLSSKIAATLIHGMPFLVVVASQLFFGIFSKQSIIEVLCLYMPGAHFNEEYQNTFGIYRTGKWENCTTIDQLTNSRPAFVQTGGDGMLNTYIIKYSSNELAYKVASLRILEISILAVTQQLLMGMCRMSLEDVTSLNISTRELGLWSITGVRVSVALAVGSLNIDQMLYNTVETIFTATELLVCILYIAAFILMHGIIKEVKIVEFLENSDETGLAIAKRATKYEQLVHLRRVHKRQVALLKKSLPPSFSM